MKSPILNVNDVELHALPAGIGPTGDAARHYAPRVAMLGAQLGARKLGCNIIALPPGKRGFPFHSHRVNEEMFLVLAGSGEIRIGGERFPLRAGDAVACPPGGPEIAHQIINTGEAELRYLALSTKLTPDIIQYPDSGKYRVMADAEGDLKPFDAIGRLSHSLDYWDGE